jgi:hypothetical protein
VQWVSGVQRHEGAAMRSLLGLEIFFIRISVTAFGGLVWSAIDSFQLSEYFTVDAAVASKASAMNSVGMH